MTVNDNSNAAVTAALYADKTFVRAAHGGVSLVNAHGYYHGGAGGIFDSTDDWRRS